MHKNLAFSLTLIATAACATPALADLTVVSHGGANKAAQVAAFYDTYQAQTGTRIVAGEFNGEMAKVKVMVDTGSVSWDVVEMEMPELARACDEGLLEDIDAHSLAAYQAVDEKWRGQWWDETNEYSSPLAYGTAGFTVNRNLYKGAVDSWKVLFEPEAEKYEGTALFKISA